MKRPRWCSCRWAWIGSLVAMPALAWALALAVVPTDWARARMVDRLSRATGGRSVRIGGLRLGIFGQLRVVDLAIAEAATPDDPWLRAAEAGVDLHLCQLLLGPCRPGEVRVEGLALRVWRRADGRFEFADLLEPPKVAGPASGDPAGPDEARPPIALAIRGGKVHYVDEAEGIRVDLDGVEARATCSARSATIDDLKGVLNGGTFALAARVDRDRSAPGFELEIRAEGIEVDRGLVALEAFVPVIGGRSGRPTQAGGKLRLRAAVQGAGATRDAVIRSIQGHGSILLDPVDLDGSRFLAELEALGEWPSKGRVGSVGADFTIAGGRFTTEDLTILVSRFPFVLGGWTDFDGRFDLSSRGDQIAAGLHGQAGAWLRDSQAHLDQLSGLRIRGDRDRVDVTIHDRPLAGDPARPETERARIRQVARQLRDRFFQ